VRAAAVDLEARVQLKRESRPALKEAPAAQTRSGGGPPRFRCGMRATAWAPCEPREL
jgi:hypothetical protein